MQMCAHDSYELIPALAQRPRALSLNFNFFKCAHLGFKLFPPSSVPTPLSLCFFFVCNVYYTYTENSATDNYFL